MSNSPSQTERTKARTLLRLFAIMLKIGALTFGGGYAMILQMTRDFVDRQGWLDQQEMTDALALAQSMPGVLAVNTAYLVGYRVAGWSGALVAALGASLPSFVVLAVVAAVYHEFIENPIVLGAMRGIRAAVTALLLSTVWRLRKTSVSGVLGWVLFAVALGLSLFTAISPVWLLLGGGLVGLAGLLWKRRVAP